MAKYNYIELDINNGKLLDVDLLSLAEQNALKLNNAIYIYKSKTINYNYIK